MRLVELAEYVAHPYGTIDDARPRLARRRAPRDPRDGRHARRARARRRTQPASRFPYLGVPFAAYAPRLGFVGGRLVVREGARP